jgi:hypothetical protein
VIARGVKLPSAPLTVLTVPRSHLLRRFYSPRIN